MLKTVFNGRMSQFIMSFSLSLSLSCLLWRDFGVFCLFFGGCIGGGGGGGCFCLILAFYDTLNTFNCYFDVRNIFK